MALPKFIYEIKIVLAPACPVGPEGQPEISRGRKPPDPVQIVRAPEGRKRFFKQLASHHIGCNTKNFPGKPSLT